MTTLTLSAADRQSILSDGIVPNKDHITGPPNIIYSPLNIRTFTKCDSANIEVIIETALSYRMTVHASMSDGIPSVQSMSSLSTTEHVIRNENL